MQRPPAQAPHPTVLGKPDGARHGDVELVAFSSAASDWTFATPILRHGLVTAALTTSNGHQVTLTASSDGRTVSGTLLFDGYSSTKTTALAVSGKKAWIAGLGSDGRPYLAYVEDNSKGHKTDLFRLWTAGVEPTSDGRLSNGDVAIG